MPTDWIEANRRYLLTSLARVRNTMRRAVEAAAGGAAADDLPTAEDDELAAREASAALPAPAALEALVAAFGLSPFERDVLLLCAGVELDSRFAADCLGRTGARFAVPDLRPGHGRAPAAALERPDADVVIAAMAADRAGRGWGALPHAPAHRRADPPLSDRHSHASTRGSRGCSRR